MTEFKASNGVKIGRNAGGQLMAHGNGLITAYVIGAHERALREFFLHEQGFWRDEETGALVKRLPGRDDVDGRAVGVIGAADARVSWERFVSAEDTTVARYFAAHPEPKPWHDAQEGEVWAVKHGDWDEAAYTVSEDFIDRVRRFVPTIKTDLAFVGILVDGKGITSARRVWPEAVSDG